MLETLRSWGGAALIVAIASAPAMADTLTFKFKEPADAAGWKAVNDIWKVKKEAYQPLSEADGYPVSMLTSPKFGDVNATVKFKPVKVEGETYYAAGLLLRSKADTDAKTVTGYLALAVATESDEADAQGYTYIYRLTKFNVATGTGTAEELCFQEFAPSSLVGIAEFAFQAVGNKLRTSYQGLTTCTAMDNKYADGKVGLFSYVPGYPWRVTEVVIETK